MSGVWTKEEIKQTTQPQTVNYETVKNTTNADQVFGGLGAYLNAMQPKNDPKTEAALKKNAKYAAWTDFFKTLAEGVALTAGQNTGVGAVPTLVPRGVNPTVQYSNDYLEKLKEQYRQDEKAYNQQMLNQKYKEVQYGIDKDQYNRNVDLKQMQDNAHMLDSSKTRTMQSIRDAQAQANYDKTFNYGLQKEKEAKETAMYGIVDPDAKGEDMKIVFKNEKDERLFFNELLRNHPELRNLKRTKTTTNELGQTTTTQEPIGNDIQDIRWVIDNAKLLGPDYDKARIITGMKPVKRQDYVTRDNTQQPQYTTEQVTQILNMLMNGDKTLDKYTQNNQQQAPQEQQTKYSTDGLY